MNVESMVSEFLPHRLRGVLLYLPQWAGASYALGAMSAISSAGTSPPVMTVSGTPSSNVIALRVEVNDISGGTGLAQAKGRWSVDGGDNYTSFTTASSVVLTGTGLTLSMSAGPYAADNVYTATAVMSQNNDVTGAGRNVTATTTARPTLARKVTGQKNGIQFDGSANVFATAASAGVNPTARTIAWTMRVDSYGGAAHEGGCISYGNAEMAVTTFQTTGVLILYPPAAGGGTAAVATGSFHHYAFVWDGTTSLNAVILYQDGVSFRTNTALGAASGGSTTFRIGQKATTAGTFGAITVMDTLLLNWAMSASEVAALYRYTRAMQGW